MCAQVIGSLPVLEEADDELSSATSCTAPCSTAPPLQHQASSLREGVCSEPQVQVSFEGWEEDEQ